DLDNYMNTMSAVYEVKQLNIAYYSFDHKSYSDLNINNSQPIFLDIDIPNTMKEFFEKAILENMKKKNIHIHLHTYNWNDLYKRVIKSETPATVLNIYSPTFDPADFLGELFYSHKNCTFGEMNWFDYKSKEMDADIEKLCELKGIQRVKMGWDIINKALKNKLFIPLYCEDLFIITRKHKCRIKNCYEWGNFLKYD
ncbi:hypothetical protein J7L48_09035, partial [bacterium]|nr:hypothetical protein [bacterium]